MIDDSSREKYLNDPYHCVYCESSKIGVKDISYTGYDSVSQTIECQECKKAWNEIYTLVYIEEIDEPIDPQ